MNCGNCKYNDGMMYASLPPMSKCTITQKFHNCDYECDVDFVLVKHGKWVETEKGTKITAYKCSECGRVVWDDTGYDVSKDYPYCHCGARMGGGEK